MIKIENRKYQVVFHLKYYVQTFLQSINAFSSTKKTLQSITSLKSIIA